MEVEPPEEWPAEQRLSSLKPYTHLAWEEWKDSNAQLRWEVFNTWMLLSSLALAEAERERFAQFWAPKPWTSEAVALRHIFMESHSMRALCAVLRWLRWSHRFSPKAARSVEEGFVYNAGYDRTRRSFQLHGRLPGPFQEQSLHPDGPLQRGEIFECADIEDERQLIADLWTCLRRGELSTAMKMCAENGQAWRTALLQGMLPFCEEPEGQYESAPMPGIDEAMEEMLATMKEEHSDWTELGCHLTKGSQGNPWRRVWKEECFDAAARNLLPGSKMDLRELSIYGFCSGNYDALMPSCNSDWADRCFGELHCLKEWLVERLLEDGQSREKTSRLGEGDVCAEEESAEDTAWRTRKLCGRLAPDPANLNEDVEAAVREEVLQLLQRLRPLPSPEVGCEEASSVSQQFGQLQAFLIAAAWEPQRGKDALELLRSWLRNAQPGKPFALKQFAAYFAVWQKNVLEDHLRTSVDVDDIVSMHVSELLLVASGPLWQDRCLREDAVEVILEHCQVLRPEPRREALASLMLRLGRSAGPQAVAEAVAQTCRGDATPLTEVVKRGFSAFWTRFPEEAFSAITFLVHRALRIDDSSAQEAVVDSAPAGVREEADVEELAFVVLCLLVFWLVARDASASTPIERASAGLSKLTGLPSEDSSGLLGLLHQVGQGDEWRFLRSALDGVVVPLLTDTLLCLCAKDPQRALPLLPAMQASSLWTDAFHSAAASTVNLSDLEWFLLLYGKHRLWKEAFREASAERSAAQAPALTRFGAAVRPGPAVGHAAEAKKASLESVAAREVLFDHARDRLGKERPLLEPLPATQTVLQEGHWQGLQKAMAWRLLLPLLDCFESESDFQGAMEELFVAVADSPWMLKTLDPRHAQALLARVAHIPTSYEWP